MKTYIESTLAAVKGTVEYRSPSGEDMPRKPLDGCKAARPLAVPPVLLLDIPLVLRAINEHKNNRPSLTTWRLLLLIDDACVHAHDLLIYIY